MCRSNPKFHVQCLNTFSFQVNDISIPEEKKKQQNFDLHLHMLLKFEIIWTRIGCIITFQNEINLCEIPYICIRGRIQLIFEITIQDENGRIMYKREKEKKAPSQTLMRKHAFWTITLKLFPLNVLMCVIYVL